MNHHQRHKARTWAARGITDDRTRPWVATHQLTVQRAGAILATIEIMGVRRSEAPHPVGYTREAWEGGKPPEWVERDQQRWELSGERPPEDLIITAERAKWRATHILTVRDTRDGKSNVLSVCLLPSGDAPTRREWMADEMATWRYEGGRWLLRGDEIPLPFELLSAAAQTVPAPKHGEEMSTIRSSARTTQTRTLLGEHYEKPELQQLGSLAACAPEELPPLSDRAAWWRRMLADLGTEDPMTMDPYLMTLMLFTSEAFVHGMETTIHHLLRILNELRRLPAPGAREIPAKLLANRSELETNTVQLLNEIIRRDIDLEPDEQLNEGASSLLSDWGEWLSLQLDQETLGSETEPAAEEEASNDEAIDESGAAALAETLGDPEAVERDAAAHEAPPTPAPSNDADEASDT